jgi:hypothetical protein
MRCLAVLRDWKAVQGSMLAAPVLIEILSVTIQSPGRDSCSGT